MGQDGMLKIHRAGRLLSDLGRTLTQLHRHFKFDLHGKSGNVILNGHHLL